MSSSNQVFSNQTDKYYNQNGLNILSSTTNTILPPQNFVKLNWENQIIQTPNLTSIEPAGTIKCLKRGMYHINVNISAQETTNPAINNLHYHSIIQTIKSIGLVTISSGECFTTGGSTAPHNTNMNCMIFLEVNDTFDIQIKCINSTGMTLGYTNCIITLM